MDEKQSESDLLERVFLRLGHVDSDEKLEEFTKKFLPPVLLKLSSPNEDVKKKVVELLTHINRRLKSRECVQLPMESLLLQYQDPLCTSYVRSFTILYLKMGFPRLTPDRQLQYLPQLFLSMKEKPKPQQDYLLQLAIPIFAILNSDKDLSTMKEIYAVLSKDKSLLELFLSFVLNIFLVPYNVFSSKVSDVQNMVAPPGLSRTALQQILTGNLNLANVEKVKLGILRFLCADLLDGSVVQAHLVVATGDSRHAVSGYAEHQLKRITEKSDREHPGVISKLMSIYLGTINLPGKTPTPPNDVRTPASLSLRLKIFPYLLKSRKSADIFPSCLQVIFQSLHGEASDKKLKSHGVQFVHHLCECSSDKVISVVSPVLLSTLMKLATKSEDADLRRTIFLAVGKISKRSPSLFQKDVGVIQNLFDSLSNEEPETGLVIIQALTMIANACKNAPESILAMIEALVLDYVNQEHPNCRLAALQVANILFPSDHVKTRYACLVASADVRDDIREEANRGLLFHAAFNSSGKALPNFSEMVSYIHQTVQGRHGYTQKYVTVAGSLVYPPETFIKVLQYLQHCLKSSAGVTKEDEDNNCIMVPIAGYIQHILITNLGVVYQYLSLIREALKLAGTNELHSVAMICLLELLVSAPSKLATKLNQEGTSWIKNFIWSSQDVIRHSSSHIFAILVCQSGKGIILQEVNQLLGCFQSTSEAEQHGTIICWGHLIGQYLAHQNDTEEIKIEDLEDSGMDNTKIEKGIYDAFKAIAGFLVSPSSLLVLAACDAVGEVCRQSAMPLPDGSSSVSVPLADGDKGQTSGYKPNDPTITKLQVVNQLAEIMNNSKEPKLCEKAAVVLGLTCVGDKSFVHSREAISKLLDASKKREVDLQFTVGEALSCAGAGKFSTASPSKWYAGSHAHEEIPDSQDTMKWLLVKIISEYISSDVAHVRKAACIWLLVILKHSSKHSSVQDMMGEIQQAFFHMLSENDEIVQEVSSKGLSLVYEFGSEKFRQSMVSSLVDTMLFGKKPTKNITADTKLFDEGTLGKAPGDGGQLSTYKELCSLANDMNQPELVYRFLHLANHNALWNSKKGAAFGFASIGAQAKKELQPHLKTLVPKLYRYQFDPNSKVREAMMSIWSAIVVDQRKVIDQYSEEILAELLANLHNPTWRVRQSCCIAVGNFLNGRSMDTMINYLPQLWAMCLRVMDDIKESVRQAAEVACKTLQTLSIRLCDVNQGKIGQEAIHVILPVLLEQGLGTKVDEVRSLALQTVVKMSKNAGSLLKPHIPVLVVALLESLSGLEPQKLNYISFHMQREPELQEKLDDARIAFSKSSPMMETITLCIQHVDATVLPDLIPRLIDLLRGGVGLGTKAGSAGLVVSLVQQCTPEELQPYAGKLLSALLAGMGDRSQSVCRKYADAIGHLVRVAKDTSTSKLFMKMKSWYLEKDNDSLQSACGLVCQAIARSSPDVLSHHAATILPVAFVAKHRKLEDGKKSVWEEIWSENTSDSARGIQLYLKEIVTMSSSMLSAQSWNRKVEAALSIQTLVTSLSTSLPKKQLEALVKALVSSLSGRTWDGKESIVSCLTSLCVKCHSSLDGSTVEEITRAILKECRKENPAYRTNAIKCLGQLLEKDNCVDFKEIYDILKPIVDPEDKKQSSADGNDQEEQPPSANLLINGFECLGHAWPTKPAQQVGYRDKILDVLVVALKKNTWKVQLAVMESIKLFTEAVSLKDVVEEDYDFVDKLVSVILSEILSCLGNLRYAAIRVKGLDVTECVLSLLQENKSARITSEVPLKELHQKLALLSNDNNANVKDKAVGLKAIVKQLLCDFENTKE